MLTQRCLDILGQLLIKFDNDNYSFLIGEVSSQWLNRPNYVYMSFYKNFLRQGHQIKLSLVVIKAQNF